MYSNRLAAVRRRLSGAGGFTMTELLACTMIMLMATSIITQTLISAMTYSQAQIWRSRAQNLCNTLTESVENVLLYANKVDLANDSHPKYYDGSIWYEIKTNSDNEMIIMQEGSQNTVYYILNSPSYKQAKADITADIEDSPLKMLKVTITVSPDPGGEHKNTVSNTFYVRPLTGDFAFPTPAEDSGGSD